MTGSSLFYFSDNIGLKKEGRIILYKQFIDDDILLPRKEVNNPNYGLGRSMYRSANEGLVGFN